MPSRSRARRRLREPYTHAFLYSLREPCNLGRRARAVLKRVDTGRDVAHVPAAVVAEALLLRERGRTAVGLPEMAEVFRATRWRFLPLDWAQLDRFANLVVLVDPFDRLIAAAAQALGAKLLSRDQRISESGLVDVVWD